MDEIEALKTENERLRKGLRYLMRYIKRSEVMFYCEYKHDGPADMAFQRLGNIRRDVHSILEPGACADWYKDVRMCIERDDAHHDEKMAELDKKIDEEDARCRKERWHR